MTQALIARLALAEQWAMQNGAPASVTDALKDAAAGAREAAGMAAELAVVSSKQAAQTLAALADPREEALHRVMELLCTSPAVVDTVWHTQWETLHDYCARAIEEGKAWPANENRASQESLPCLGNSEGNPGARDCSLAQGFSVQPEGWQEGDELPESVLDAVAEALGDAYDCTRVWEAWFVGTMSQDDFHSVADSSERVEEIARAAVSAFVAAKGGGGCKRVDYERAVQSAQDLASMMGEGWQPRVWENLGWHYSATFGAATVHRKTSADGGYWVCIHGKPNERSYYGEHAEPRKAFCIAFKAMEANARELRHRIASLELQAFPIESDEVES